MRTDLLSSAAAVALMGVPAMVSAQASGEGAQQLEEILRILTKSPDLDAFDAAAMVDTGVTDGGSLRQRYDGMVNVPLVDEKLALRVVGFYRDEEGYLDNIGTGIEDSNTLIDWGGRSILASTSKAATTATISLSHWRRARER